MTVRAQVVTRWQQSVDMYGQTYNRPAIDGAVAFASGDACDDVTGQPAQNIPTAPNLLVVECVVSDATFAAILAHPDYGPGSVLWSEPA